MTTLLEEAFSKIAKLSKEEQDAIAAWLMEELASERRWDDLFSHSQPELASLAEEALADYRQGRTRKLGLKAL